VRLCCLYVGFSWTFPLGIIFPSDDSRDCLPGASAFPGFLPHPLEFSRPYLLSFSLFEEIMRGVDQVSRLSVQMPAFSPRRSPASVFFLLRVCLPVKPTYNPLSELERKLGLCLVAPAWLVVFHPGQSATVRPHHVLLCSIHFRRPYVQAPPSSGGWRDMFSFFWGLARFALLAPLVEAQHQPAP